MAAAARQDYQETRARGIMRLAAVIPSTLTALFVLLAACGGSDTGQAASDATDMPYAEGSREARAVLVISNDTELGFEQFDSNEHVGLDARAARNLVDHRDGPDPLSLDDDDPFDTLAELWGVPYCKSRCVGKLLDYAKRTGVFDSLGDYGGARAIFSPQPMAYSHLVEAARLIDAAEHSIDIAMYSYSHQDPVRGALERALDRGVAIRFLANTDLANSSSKAGGLEALGIDVRRVTKIMHHKFAIIDGPRSDDTLDRASTAKLLSGSGNWSSSAATIYDENTVVIEGGYPELTLRLQRDFDTLWAGSKDKVYEPSLVWDQTRADITDAIIAQVENPNTHAWFTSVNFEPTGNQGWSALGTTAVTDQLVAAITAAESSLDIASGHFVSIPIAQAVADALAADPDLEVRIVLDCQETSKGREIGELKEQIEAAGGSIYYKCNTHRWHYKLAKQMHHKYVIVDDAVLYTGSLNFSDNAESNTFENVLMFQGPEHAELLESYQENFVTVRQYGRADELAALTELQDEIVYGDAVPLTWAPLSLELDTFGELKDLIREHCPATRYWEDTPEARTYDVLFNRYPQWFEHCEKTGYPWPEVPAELRED